MRLDEAVKAAADGKKLEHDCYRTIEVGHGNVRFINTEDDFVICLPNDGWRLKRETLNPMQAWEKMKAGKVVRSDAIGSVFRVVWGILECRTPHINWERVVGLQDDFMSATDLYEVEDES